MHTPLPLQLCMSNGNIKGTLLRCRWTENATNTWWLGDVQASVVKLSFLLYFYIYFSLIFPSICYLPSTSWPHIVKCVRKWAVSLSLNILSPCLLIPLLCSCICHFHYAVLTVPTPTPDPFILPFKSLLDLELWIELYLLLSPSRRPPLGHYLWVYPIHPQACWVPIYPIIPEPSEFPRTDSVLPCWHIDLPLHSDRF